MWTIRIGGLSRGKKRHETELAQASKDWQAGADNTSVCFNHTSDGYWNSTARCGVSSDTVWVAFAEIKSH